MRGLFSMLFGASMLLVIERAAAAGRSEARTHYARMVVLLLFGLLHFYLIWHGDILALYALTGMVAFLFRDCATRTLLRWATALLLVATLSFSGAAYEMRAARPRRPRARRDRERHRALECDGQLRDQVRRRERRGDPPRARPDRRSAPRTC